MPLSSKGTLVKRLIPAALLAAFLLAVGAAYAIAQPHSSAHAAAARTTVGLRATKLGKVLVNGRGLTLYLFEKDPRGRSACAGACASIWPPLTASGKLTAGRGVNPRMLATFRRSDGRRQVSYNGHALYFYAGDSRPGQTTGQNLNQFGAKWFVLSARGVKVP
jgi:predicted lipoprotein with Yx(FWY)xxD motif